MKKIFIIISLTILMVGCSNMKIESEISDLSTYYEYLTAVEQVWEYPFIKTNVSLGEIEKDTFNLYKEYQVNSLNYKEYDPMMTLEISSQASGVISNITFIIYGDKKLSESSFNYIKTVVTTSMVKLLKDADEKEIKRALEKLEFPESETFTYLSNFESKKVRINDNSNLISKVEDGNFLMIFTNV